MPLTYHVLMKPQYRAADNVQGIVLQACGYSAQKRCYRPVANPVKADRLILWGIGDPEVARVADQTRANGGHVIAWDLGYWRRQGIPEERGFRVSIDAMHPDRYIMARQWPKERWETLGIELHQDWDPHGPVILIGMGYKSAKMYGEEIGQWERETAAAIRARWPDRKLIFRPKPGNPRHCQSVPDAEIDNSRPIAEALKGASLAVCRHSNVGVDAIIAGVPAVTIGGAAAAVLPSTLDTEHSPLSVDLRRRFLYNLAWFEWTPAEIRKTKMWDVLEQMIEDDENVLPSRVFWRTSSGESIEL